MVGAHTTRTQTRASLGTAICLTAVVSCSADRAGAPLAPAFDEDIAPILQAQCAGCHGANSPAAGWSAVSFLSAIGCIEPSDAPATLPSDSTAPILHALDTPPHQGLLSAGERSALAAWIAAGTPGFRNGVHAPGVADPRSSAFHGAALRAVRWAPMFDPNDPNACGRCHDGVPSRPSGIVYAAPGAPACTSCHSEPDGVLACSTCHGMGGARSYPPRDPCFFPGDAARAGAHAAHVEPSTSRSIGLTCSTCHPMPGPSVIGGLHGNGSVEIIFDPTLVTPEASYDRASGTCAVSCHDRGGARPRPAWSQPVTPGCGECHGSPPAGHDPGACNRCHQEANADGTALSGGPLHMNGRVDLGDGSGKCGACHGTGDSPWPTSGAHPAHQNPTLTAPIACSSCHVVPSTMTDPTHLRGPLNVRFSGLANARDTMPAWNGSRCSNVACHGAKLADPAAAPTWSDTSGNESKCGACHGIPPSQHTPSTECNRADCHGGEVSLDVAGTPSITSTGKSMHIDGVVESAR